MSIKETILVVDDTQINIDILIDLLKDYDVIVAVDGQSAIDVLEEEYKNIDLILLDIMMPDMDGFEVCEILKKDLRVKNIPVIFLTAKTDNESIQTGFELGGVDYITKPFRPIELLARVRTHLNLVNHEKKAIEESKFIALRELIHNIAHQWRQPLSVISMSASSLSMKKELEDLSDIELYDLCNTIDNSAQQLSDTIDSFHTVITQNNEKSIFNLNQLIEDNSSLLFCQSVNTQITPIINIDKTIQIEGFKNQLIESLIYITTNSKDALNRLDIQDKMVFIDGYKNENQIILNIYDNARGIDDAIINKIFEPYFTTEHQSRGKGLGLYSVYKMITESFNGTINVSNIEFSYNSTIYEGAKFEIQIPIN